MSEWFADLKAIAFSGSYNDLSNTPSPLDTYEEITANTTSGKFAGALGVQEGFEQLTSSLNINKITTTTELITLVGQLQSNGTRKMFYASKSSYFSGFPSALSSVAIESPFVTITRLDGVYVLLEIVAFNSGTGLPKTIKGICNFTTGNFDWNDVV